VTARLSQTLGIPATTQIVPMTDDSVATQIKTPDGWLSFQDYFVRRHHADPVLDVRFAGVEHAHANDLAMAALAQADLIVFCPSNPIVSIGPILALAGMRSALSHRREQCCRVAVSPIVGGHALRGPADRMMEGLGHESSALGVARYYAGLIDIFVLDQTDADLAPAIADLGMQPVIANTIMRTPEDSRALAQVIVAVAQEAGRRGRHRTFRRATRSGTNGAGTGTGPSGEPLGPAPKETA